MEKLRMLLMSALVVFAGAGASFGQQGPGANVNPGRDCQTITTCQYRKGSQWRGCISTYSCRVCSFVASSCAGAGKGKRCFSSRCTWG